MEGDKLVLILLAVLVVIWLCFGGCSEGYSHYGDYADMCSSMGGANECTSPRGEFMSHCAKPSAYMLTTDAHECAPYAPPYDTQANVRAVPSVFDPKGWFVPSTKYGSAPPLPEDNRTSLGEYATTRGPDGMTPCQRYCATATGKYAERSNGQLSSADYKGMMDDCLKECESSMTAPLQANLESVPNEPVNFCVQSSLKACPDGNENCIQTVQAECSEIFDL